MKPTWATGPGSNGLALEARTSSNREPGALGPSSGGWFPGCLDGAWQWLAGTINLEPRRSLWKLQGGGSLCMVPERDECACCEWSAVVANSVALLGSDWRVSESAGDWRLAADALCNTSNGGHGQQPFLICRVFNFHSSW